MLLSKSRILWLFLALILCFPAMPVFAYQAPAADVWRQSAFVDALDVGEKTGLSGDAYTDENGIEHRIDDFHLPRILLDSKFAAQANAEIESMLAAIEASFLEGKAGGYSAGSSNYTVFERDGLLSVLVALDYLHGSWMSEYHRYVFRLADGQLLTNKEILAAAAPYAALDGVIEKAVSDFRLPRDRYSDDAAEQEMAAMFRSRSLENYWAHPDDYKLYFDEIGQLRLIAPLMIPAGSGTIIERLLIDLPDVDAPVNPAFARIALVKGIAPEQYPDVFVGLLGAASTPEELIDPFRLLGTFKSVFAPDQDVQFLPRLSEDDAGSKRLSGYEYYVLIPRYATATATLHALALDEVSAELIDDPDVWWPEASGQGVLAAAVNESDLFPNANIVIRFRDSEFAFAPAISLKDGSLTLPSNAVDITDVLNELPYVESDQYTFSDTLIPYIESLMPAY